MSHFVLLVVLFLYSLRSISKADEENNLLTKLDCQVQYLSHFVNTGYLTNTHFDMTFNLQTVYYK